jgi:hypothetical protein
MDFKCDVEYNNNPDKNKGRKYQLVTMQFNFIFLGCNIFNFTFTARRPAKQPEETTEVFQQPEDEIPVTAQPKINVSSRRMEAESIVAPFSCNYADKWYREGEQFLSGIENCAVCTCRNGKVTCNEEACPRLTGQVDVNIQRPTPRPTPRTTTTRTTPTPTTTTTQRANPFYPEYDASAVSNGQGMGGRGDTGFEGEQGRPGSSGSPGKFETFYL